MLNISSTLPQIQPKLANNNISFQGKQTLAMETLAQDTVSFTGKRTEKQIGKSHRAFVNDLREMFAKGQISAEFVEKAMHKRFPETSTIVFKDHRYDKQAPGQRNAEMLSVERTFDKGKPKSTIYLNLDKIESYFEKADKSSSVYQDSKELDTFFGLFTKTVTNTITNKERVIRNFANKIDSSIWFEQNVTLKNLQI